MYTVSTYSFEAHKKSKEIRILDLSNSQSTPATKEEKTSEPHWLEDDILWLKEGQKGAIELIVANGGDLGDTYTAAVIPGPVSDAKLKPLGIGKIAVVFTGKSTPEGDLFNPENEPKKLSSGLVYDSLMVRHWDEYVTPNRNALWYGLFQRSQPHITESKGRWSLSPLINALKGTHLESPIPPFPGTGHYDISSTGIAFVAKDPAIDPAFNTRCDFYFLSVSNFTTASSSQPQKASVEGLEGAASSPVFSPNGRSAAFLKMKRNGYESDKNRLIVILDIDKLSAATEVLKSNDGAGLWDRSPSSFIWSNDGQSLYLVAEEKGKEILFEVDVPATPVDMNKVPEKITNSGSVSGVQTLGSSRELFISSSNLIDNSVYSTLDPDHLSSLKQISSNSRNGTSFGLSPDQVFDIWFDGSGDYKVHAWVVRPSHFDDSKKYPLAYVIHGGPQGSWNEQWSTRWNPAVFAEQGYVVVTPNPTGSTGYGQAFTDAIEGNWGGAPYEDLVKGLKYIKAHMPYVDTSRSVALGASYGGYMINWIQGHPLGRDFCALVCHDGVFSMANQMSSDEQYFPNHDLGGPFWRNQSGWEKWDPARHTGEWKTPQLIIHNALDYRLPITEGLAAFNVLQERGVESRFLTFPDENHWVLKEENSLVWHTVVLNWINKYVGLPPYKDDGQEGYEMQSRPILGRESGLVMR